MRRLLPGLLLATVALAGVPDGTAQAQVTVNPGALDLLPARPGPHAAPTKPAPAHPAPGHRGAGNSPSASTKPAPTAPAAGAAAAAAAPPKPTLPTVPPAIAALPPPAPVPPPRPQPIPLVPVVADAPGTASPQPGGIRVTFGKDRQDLNPSTEAALRTLAKRLKPDDTTSINIYAYATGTPEDPSTARRLALARALAARAVLITEGIPSTRIYPRSLGSVGGDTDPDRVDVVAGPAGPPASASPPVASPPGPSGGAPQVGAPQASAK